MKSIRVVAEHKYEVSIDKSFDRIRHHVPEGAVWVTTQSLRDILPIDFPTNRTIFVPDGEGQKSFDSLKELLEQCAARGLTRSSTLVGVGGGATTDLVGFAASIYMRGISWIAVPTSLAGMVDAAIGGKTGINIEAGKNLVGSFYSPRSVLIATDFLSTLSERDLRAGMAEVIKCGFIADSTILALAADDLSSHITELISRSVQVKADVVSQDFKEGDRREILNYGHTLGHAIESHSKYSLRHGEAIAIGLLFAAEVSHRLGRLSSNDRDVHFTLISQLNLPSKYEGSAWPALFDIMMRDKKRRGNGLRFVTLDSVGSTSRLDGLTNEILEPIYREVIAG